MPLYHSSVKFIRATVLRSIAAHENTEHQGEACWDERYNLLAFLAHALGITVSQLSKIEPFLQAYEDHHTKTKP